MRLLLVAGRFPQRSETFVYRKAVALARRGHHVVVGSRQAGDWTGFSRDLPPTLEVEVWPPDGALQRPSRMLAAGAAVARNLVAPGRLGALWNTVRANATAGERTHTRLLRHLPFAGRHFDVVHFEFLSLAPLYPHAGELLHAPVAVSVRGTEIHTINQRPPELRAQLVAALIRAGAVHCVSSEIAGVVRDLTGRTEGVWINRPAVDITQQPRPDRARTGPLRVITTGRMVWQKGFDHLLAALALVKQRGVAVEAEILGDGELLKSLRFSVGDLGLGDVVSFPGAVPADEVLARLRTADAFVLSSHTEGISNAVLEAMAAGLPIITTDVGGMREAVSDGCEGLLVPARDVRALAAAIERLATDEPVRARLGRAARERAVAEFSLERQATVFEEMYGQLIGRRGKVASSV